MQIEGIVTVEPSQSELAKDLAALMGEAYLEEPYTKAFLEGIRAKEGQDIEVSTAMKRALIDSGIPAQRVHCTPDGSACMIAYRASEQTRSNMDFQNEAVKAAQESPSLGDKQAPLVFLQNMIMMPIGDFEWYPEVVGEGADYLHLAHVAVKKDQQGSGKVGQLVKPLLDYAQANSLPVFLETYSDDQEAMFKHFGFETITVLDSPTTPLKERCMMYLPDGYVLPVLPEGF